MNISDQLQQIFIFFAENRFIATLKEISHPFVASIEIDRVSGQKASHQSCQRICPGSKEKVRMVGDQSPGIAEKTCFSQARLQAADKFFPILIVVKYPGPVNTSNNDVMKSSGIINSSFSRHGTKISKTGERGKH